MIELKSVVTINDEIFFVGDWDYKVELEEDENGVKKEVEKNPLPIGALIEKREMEFTVEDGWRESGLIKEPSEIEKLKADLTYIAIMSGVEL